MWRLLVLSIATVKKKKDGFTASTALFLFKNKLFINLGRFKESEYLFLQKHKCST